MAIFKCKMCGGNLEVTNTRSVIECDYCGTSQTIPVPDDEKKVNLFNRANKLRLKNDFDKAEGLYESIVSEFPDEAEAYWGICLCKYGIEYVDDPATGAKIPTCHRTSFKSIFDEENYALALENADSIAKKVYEDEAKAIDILQKDILQVVNSVEPYDVFLCYKETGADGERTHDSVLAQDIYEELTAKGLKVFFSRITLEDKLGTAYEPYIFAALNSAKVMLSIGTKPEHFNAVWVKNEWSRYLDFMKNDRKRTLIPCYKDMDPYDMPEEFSNLQAQNMGKIGAMQDLVRGVLKVTGRSDKDTSTAKNTEEIDLLKNSINELNKNETRRKKNIKKLIIGIIAAVVVLGGAAAAAIVFAVPHLNYNNAVDVMNKGQYTQAAEMFAEMGDYKDSATMINQCYYLLADEYKSVGDYDAAIAEFTKLGDYLDSATMVQQCHYLKADEYRADGDYDTAITEFTKLGEYQDSIDKIKECKYQKAAMLADSGDNDAALALYGEISGYSDVSDKKFDIYLKYYNQGLELYEQKSYIEAEKAFSKTNGILETDYYLSMCEDKQIIPYSAFELFNTHSISSVKSMVSLTEGYVYPNVYYVNDNIRIVQNVDYQSDYFYEITLIGPNIHLFEGNGKYDKITGDMTFNEIEQVLGKDFWTKNDMSFIRSDGSIYYQPDDIGGTLYLNFVPNGDLTYDVSFGSWW